MPEKEGSISAPIRYAIDWQNPEFYHQPSLLTELERVFDICHGCRRCVNLCQAFPTLFDLIDESETLEIDSVDKKDYQRVVDQCYLCDLCYMTKCPYVPPHEWNVDFPSLMLRAKAVHFKVQKPKLANRVLTSPATLGKLGSIPIISTTVNKVMHNRHARTLLAKMLNVHPEAHIPNYHSKKALNQKFKALPPPQKSTNKVAIFTTCYGKYNTPQIVTDLYEVLYHNGVEPTLIEGVSCCAMSKLELGDIQTVVNFANKNKYLLQRYLDDGYHFIAPIPSCVLMFKNEIPRLLPDDKLIADIASAFFDPFEYLVKLKTNGQLNTDFKPLKQTIFYQVACHQRVQNIGAKTKQILSLIPQLTLKTIERCSGHNGTYGVRYNSYENAKKIAQPVASQVGENADAIISDCILAAQHISHIKANNIPAIHPISFVKKAYGI